MWNKMAEGMIADEQSQGECIPGLSSMGGEESKKRSQSHSGQWPTRKPVAGQAFVDPGHPDSTHFMDHEQTFLVVGG